MRTCSRTSWLGEDSRATNVGTAPVSMTTLVCAEVPDAMLVRAHAASSCKPPTSHTSPPRLAVPVSPLHTRWGWGGDGRVGLVGKGPAGATKCRKHTWTHPPAGQGPLCSAGAGPALGPAQDPPLHQWEVGLHGVETTVGNPVGPRLSPHWHSPSPHGPMPPPHTIPGAHTRDASLTHQHTAVSECPSQPPRGTGAPRRAA